MRTPIECTRCSTIIGQHISYPMTFSGQDAPEDEFEDWAIEDENGDMYCSQDCLDAQNGYYGEEDEHEEDFPDEDVEEMREDQISDPRDTD